MSDPAFDPELCDVEAVERVPCENVLVDDNIPPPPGPIQSCDPGVPLGDPDFPCPGVSTSATVQMSAGIEQPLVEFVVTRHDCCDFALFFGLQVPCPTINDPNITVRTAVGEPGVSAGGSAAVTSDGCGDLSFDFFLSIPPGPDGVAGAQGAPGAQGATGAQGPTGVTGANGSLFTFTVFAGEASLSTVNTISLNAAGFYLVVCHLAAPTGSSGDSTLDLTVTGGTLYAHTSPSATIIQDYHTAQVEERENLTSVVVQITDPLIGAVTAATGGTVADWHVYAFLLP